MLMRSSVRGLVFICSLAMLALTGCSGLTSSDKPALTTWWLTPYTGMARLEGDSQKVSLSLSVTAIPGLDTDRILALTSDAELKPYSAARWTENLPELSSSIVSRTLTASGHYEVISSGDFSTKDSCKLRLQLNSFFSSLNPLGQADNVNVAFEGRLQCPSKPDVQLQLQQTVAVRDQRMKSIVASFQQALDAVMQQMLQKLEDGQ